MVGVAMKTRSELKLQVLNSGFHALSSAPRLPSRMVCVGFILLSHANLLAGKSSIFWGVGVGDLLSLCSVRLEELPTLLSTSHDAPSASVFEYENVGTYGGSQRSVPTF